MKMNVTWMELVRGLSLLGGLCVAGVSRADGYPDSGEVTKFSAPVVELGPIVTADETTKKAGVCANFPPGSVCNMNQYEADKYCRAQGWRLPTVRELAKEGQRLGAQGLLEGEVYGGLSRYKKKDYQQILELNGDNQIVSVFYFSYRGYKVPEGELGDRIFWSSSLHHSDSIYAYQFTGYTGGLSAVFRGGGINYYESVRCMQLR